MPSPSTTRLTRPGNSSRGNCFPRGRDALERGPLLRADLLRRERRLGTARSAARISTIPTIQGRSSAMGLAMKSASGLAGSSALHCRRELQGRGPFGMRGRALLPASDCHMARFRSARRLPRSCTSTEPAEPFPWCRRARFASMAFVGVLSSPHIVLGTRGGRRQRARTIDALSGSKIPPDYAQFSSGLRHDGPSASWDRGLPARGKLAKATLRAPFAGWKPAIPGRPRPW